MSASTAKRPPGQTKTVLLAEDGEIVRKMINEMLTAKGYTVISKADGRDALNYFREHSREIDLIVTDVVMPNMDGHELGRECRHRRPKLGILYISGYADSRIDPEQDLVGNADFIAKPFRSAEFIEKVKALVASSENH